jgi:nucleoid-associated protein YgaU
MTRLAVPTANAASLGARVMWGAAAGIGLVALLAGAPAALAAAFGWPPPVPSGNAIEYPHLHEGELAAIALAWAGWLVWAWLACTIIAQLIQILRWGIRPETMRDTASPVRWLAGALIGTVATALPAAGAFAATPAATTATTGLDSGTDTTDEHRAARPLVWATAANTAMPATATDAAPVATGDDTVHTVGEEENLWILADQYYGDLQQHSRIWEANQDRTFDDGRTFTDPGKIWPGWDLIIPGTQPPAATTTEEDGFVHETVDPGETLSGYAAKYLGDESRYDEIAEANDDRVQADGRTLTDPDHIVDGWDIIIPVEAETEAPPATEPEPDPADPEPPVPDAGDDGPVPDSPATDDNASTEEAPPGTTEPDAPNEQADSGSEAGPGSMFETVPFGIWLTGGTCLAAATVVALAARLKRRRASTGVIVQQSGPDAPMTGRLSDLEAKIEAENRKLSALIPDEDPVAPTVAVDAHRSPVDLRHLAGNGIGLLGAGQHGVARAAIIAAATADTDVRITQAANLRLELNAEQLPQHVRLVADLPAALAEETSDEVLLLCADTEVDQGTRAVLDRFLAADGHGAIILGEWAPAAIRIAGTGTVEDTLGNVAEDLDMLHIADFDTAAAILVGLQGKEPHLNSDVSGESSPVQAESELEADAGDSVEEAADPFEETRDEPPGELESPMTVPHLCLFGQPEVYMGDTPVVFKKGRRAKTFLAALALADEPVSRTDLMKAVLPGYDDPVKARSNLNTIGSATRGNLQEATGTESPIYHWDKGTDRYELEPDAFTTDRDVFDAAEQAAALATDPNEAAAHLEKAVGLYTGDLTPDLHTPEVDQLREQYRAAAVRALRKLAEHHAAGGDGARAKHYRSRAAALTPEAGSP